MSRTRAVILLLAVLASSATLGALATLRWIARESPQEPKSAPIAPPPETFASPGRRAAPGGGEEPAQPANPKDDRLTKLNNDAIDALNQRDFDRAIELFEQCRRLDSTEEVFAHNLAEALARKAIAQRELEHPCAACIELLERAHGLAPEREDVSKLLERWKREADLEKDFWRESSTHFELAYDGSRDEILFSGNKILNELEDDYGEFVRFFGVAPVEEGRPRISVSLYRREGFSQLTGLGDWAGGAFDGVVRIPVGDFKEEGELLDRVMRHELAHAFVREAGGVAVPGWLNEGLAQWLEPDPTSNVAMARERMQGVAFFPLDRLTGTLATWSEKDEIARAYAQSLLMVDWIVQRYGERVLLDVIGECKNKVAPEQSFERFTHVPLATLLDDLQRGL